MIYNKKYIFITSLMTCFYGLPNTVLAQSAHTLLREGDAAYLRKDYKKAEDSYRNAQAAERSYKGSFNLGNTLYMQQRYEDAEQIFDGVAHRAPDNKMRSEAFYNKGNTHILKNEYDKAIENYKESLRLNPNDLNAKKNLAFAKKQQEKQQKQDKNPQQNPDKNQQQPQNPQQNPDKNQQQPQNPQQNPDKNQQQPQNPQQNQDKNQQQPQKQQPDMNNDNAERLLKIMDNEDQKVQQRLKKGKPTKKAASGKDW